MEDTVDFLGLQCLNLKILAVEMHKSLFHKDNIYIIFAFEEKPRLKIITLQDCKDRYLIHSATPRALQHYKLFVNSWKILNNE